MTIVEIRQKLLVEFDYYIINAIGDEDIIDSWLMGGLPDGWDDTDLEDIASDDELWLDCVECFARCCKRAGVI